MPLLYDFDSVLNFRDFGGLNMATGPEIRPGLLFRSAHFHRASDEDLARISDLDIGLRVDLRSPGERGRQPSRWPEISTTQFLEVNADNAKIKADALAPHEMFLKEEMHTAEDARQYMIGSYAKRPHDPAYRRAFSQTLAYMAQAGQPLVVHCTAGKDRTGTLAAIILSVLGADEAAVYDDYMRTMQAVDIDALVDRAQPSLEQYFGRRFARPALKTMFGVEPDFLRASLDAIGDMDAYVREALNISDQDRAAILAHYRA